MSRSKKDRTFPHGNGLSSDAQLAKIIAEALREDFGDSPSSIKRIGRLTGANLRAIKNWYIAKNAPSSRYLLILAKTSPSILRFILMQVGGEDLWDVFDLFQRQMIKPKALMHEGNSVSKDTNLSEKTVTSRSPKERQAWFLEQIIDGQAVTAEGLMARWSVNLRTARRDISGLLHSRQITFRGSRKGGGYELLTEQGADAGIASHLPHSSHSAPEKRRRGRPKKNPSPTPETLLPGPRADSPSS